MKKRAICAALCLTLCIALGGQAAAAERGVSFILNGAVLETEIAEQVAQLETQLAGNPDAIIIAPLDGDAMLAFVKRSYELLAMLADAKA